MLLFPSLLMACSVYDIRPDIDPAASIHGGTRYEADLKICQDRVAAQPRGAGAGGGMATLAATALGASLAGGGAALFRGNAGEAAGWGGLTGAAAGFKGWGESIAASPVPSDSLRVETCLQRRGYTILWPRGLRLHAFNPPLEP